MLRPSFFAIAFLIAPGISLAEQGKAPVDGGPMDCAALQSAAPDGGGRTICADVVAMDQMLVYNRFGSFNPFGMIFALRRDVVPMETPILAATAEDCDSRLGTETVTGALQAGQVRLKDCKRPRPMVLRANVGDTLHIRLTNLLLPNQPDLSSSFCRNNDQRGQDWTNVRPHVSDSETVTLGDALCPSAGPSAEAEEPDQNWPRSRGLNFAVQGLQAFAPAGQVVDAACLGLRAVPANTPINCYYRIEREGPFFLTSTAAPSGGEGDGGSLTHGLFGAVVAQKAGTSWYRSQLSPAAFEAFRDRLTSLGKLVEAASGAFDLTAYDTTVDQNGIPVLGLLQSRGGTAYEIVHSDLNAVVANPAHADDPREGDKKPPAAFREFSVFFHDELKSFYTRNFEELANFSQLAGARDGFAINYGASGMGTVLLANRKGIGPSANCAECFYEEFFLTSWANGDPALLEQYSDDPSNVHHSYLNDPVVFRNFHAGPKETHVFHLHAHQWFAGNDAGRGAFLDSQTVGPQQAFTYDIDGGRMEVYHPAAADRPGWMEVLGSGNRNRTVGDSIFHCHLYPHFAQGMWELWRVHDVIEDGTRKLPDGQQKPGLSLEQQVLDDGTPAPVLRRTGSVDRLTGQQIEPSGRRDALGTPIPGLVPLPGEPWPLQPSYASADAAEGAEIDAFPGYPFYIPGQPGHRPPQAPMDLARRIAADGNSLTDEVMDGGLPRHVVTDAATRVLPFDISKAEPKLASADRHERETAQAQIVAKALALGDMTMKLETAPLELIDYNGSPLERAAMRFHSDGEGLTLRTVDGRSVSQQGDGLYRPAGAAKGFAVNGSAPKPGAPFADPCGRPRGIAGVQPGTEWPPLLAELADPLWRFGRAEDRPIAPTPGFVGFRRYEASAVQLDLVTNRAGWHDPQARINVLTSQAALYKDGAAVTGDRRLRRWPVADDARPDVWAPVVSADEAPFFFRAVSGECIEFRHRNELPHVLALDDFQVRTPTDTIGQHIHLVKFDVTSSDGSSNGWNYEDGTFAPDEIAHRICAAKAAGMETVPTGSRNGSLQLGEVEGLCEGGHVSPRYADRIWRLPSDTDATRDLFQTTVQRWFADPILSQTGITVNESPEQPFDRTLRTVFSHDHFGPSSIQQHGFYTALIVEPRTARICDPANLDSCEALRPDNDAGLRVATANHVGDRKSIRDMGALDDQDQDYREFALAVADFALLYDPRDRIGGRAADITAAAGRHDWTTRMPSDHGKGMAALFCEGLNPADPARCETERPDEPVLIPASIAAGYHPQHRADLIPGLLDRSEIALRFADDQHPTGALTLGDHLLRWRRMAAGYQPHDADAPLARPVAAPDRPESISVDHHDPYLLNYRGEPMPLRLGTSTRAGDDCSLIPIADWLDPLVEGATQRCEISMQRPLPEGESANVFVSAGEVAHGDPALPPLRVNEGDRVMIRLVQGAQEVQHAFTLEGMTFPRNMDHIFPSAMIPLDNRLNKGTLAAACWDFYTASGGHARDYREWARQEPVTDAPFWQDYKKMLAQCFNAEGRISTQEVGISEHFEFKGAYVAGSNIGARSMFPAMAASANAEMAAEIQRLRPHGDTLMHFGSVDSLWNGAWTFLRVFDQPEPVSRLQRNPEPVEPSDAEPARAIREALTGQPEDVSDQAKEAANDLLASLNIDKPLPFGGETPVALIPPDMCRGTATVEAVVAAVSARRAFPSSGGTGYSDRLTDPDGLFLALIDPANLPEARRTNLPGATEGEVLAAIRGSYDRPEPLVLPFRAGECLRVQWVNLLVPHARNASTVMQGLMDHYGDARMPGITSLDVDRDSDSPWAHDVRPSARFAVSLALPVMGDMRSLPNPFGINAGPALAAASGREDQPLQAYSPDNLNGQITTIDYYGGQVIVPRGKSELEALTTLFAPTTWAEVQSLDAAAQDDLIAALLADRNLDQPGLVAPAADLMRNLLPATPGETPEQVLDRVAADMASGPLLQRKRAEDTVSLLAASQVHFIPYAYGAMPIRATGDLVQHVLHGMNGAVLVMPKDAEVTESGIERRVDGARTLLVRAHDGDERLPTWVTRITTNDPDEQSHSIRQFTLFWQDGLNFRQNGTPVPDCRVCGDSYDRGEAGVNMKSEPFFVRLARAGHSTTMETDLNGIDFGPDFFRLAPNEIPDATPMPVLRAEEGEEITIHVVDPGGRARQRAFATIGQDYEDLFHGFGFPRAALLAPGKTVTAQLLHKAVPGCYLWFDGPTTLRAGGTWGLLDVVSTGAGPQETSCRRDASLPSK